MYGALRTKLIGRLLIPLVLLLVLTACGSPTNTTTPPSQSGSAPGWMINHSALSLLQGAGMSSGDIAHFFNTPNTYIMGTMPSDWHSVQSMTFTSYAAMQQAFASGSVPDSVGAIVYDNEDWSFTPLVEQQQFATYVQEAASLAHAHHKLLIATPATDLVNVVAPGTASASGDKYDRFLATDIIQAAARVADIVEVQAQGSEADTAKYAQFVSAAASQAKAANPRIIVFAGLSTNPSGQHVTGAQLYAAYQATHNVVAGYWLNIPGEAGGYCPRCGTPQPQVAIDFLRMLS